MTLFSRQPIHAVVMQHVEEAADLRRLRSTLVRAPRARLLEIARLDERIAAHLDGIRVAGPLGAQLAALALQEGGVGEVFAACVAAIERQDADALDRLLTFAERAPSARTGLLSGLGWVSASRLQGIVKELLESARSSWRRESGITACALHGVRPGPALAAALGDADAGLRAAALRAAGRTACVDLVGACVSALRDPDPRCAFEAARAALLLGDRADAGPALERLAGGAPSRSCMAALRLVLKTTRPEQSRRTLAALAQDPARLRCVITGIAAAGDPHYVPWLIDRMSDRGLARIAGEAFTFITGVDLTAAGLERVSPQEADAGPGEDPADERVAPDEDGRLPWPDRDEVAAWWKTNGARFAAGTCCFMGQVPTPQSCLNVLKTGSQRQRIAAAEYLSLLTPGTPLFNVAAPAPRQRRQLGLGPRMR